MPKNASDFKAQVLPIMEFYPGDTVAHLVRLEAALGDNGFNHSMGSQGNLHISRLHDVAKETVDPDQSMDGIDSHSNHTGYHIPNPKARLFNFLGLMPSLPLTVLLSVASQFLPESSGYLAPLSSVRACPSVHTRVRCADNMDQTRLSRRQTPFIKLGGARITGNKVRCDIYEPPLSLSSYEKLCERFIAFLESINRIRRVNVPQRYRQRHPNTPNDPTLALFLRRW
ncbi:hypothetical protein Aperf_G00000079093 [Anoplocephala perfoliata]